MPGPDRNEDNLVYLMRAWLFGTFIVVFAVTSAYIGLFTGATLGEVIGAAWPVWAITLLATLAVYFGYVAYLNRRP